MNFQLDSCDIEALIRKIQNLKPSTKLIEKVNESIAERKANRGMRKVSHEEALFFEKQYRNTWVKLHRIRRWYGLHSFEYDDHKWKTPERWWYT